MNSEPDSSTPADGQTTTLIVLDTSGCEEFKEVSSPSLVCNQISTSADEMTNVAAITTTTAPKSNTATTISSFPKVSLRLNEFGIYELMPEEPMPKPTISLEDSITIKPVDSSGAQSDRDRWKANIEIVCCKQCDGYGIADEFVDKNFCSEKCRKLGSRVSLVKTANPIGKFQANKRKSISHVDAEASQELPAQRSDRSAISDSYRENSLSKSFSWSKYLERRRAQAAPERLFSDPFPYGKHGFRPGMKLEGIDPEHQSLFCVLTVAEVQGYRLRLHFDGYSDSHDYWVNADSENIFPCGWCEKNGQKLQVPKNYDSQRPFSWTVYLKQSGVGAAPRHLFSSTRSEYPVPSAFRVKMKLEAVDRRHSSHTLCVATVANVIGSRFLVHFDGWDDIYDYWADPSCPYVHPVGWSNEHNMPLTPPCDYDASEGDFSWDRYLAQTGSTAVPPRAFKPRSPVGFKTGMKLECVDPRNPQLIRVATIAAVKGYRVKIHFDGWSTDFDFWTDDDWPDLHPPGWCFKTSHSLQGPPGSSWSESSPSTSECPTPGCIGIGHIEGAKYATHRSLEHCPYYSRNLHRENPAFPDRLAGTEEQAGEEKRPKEESRKELLLAPTIVGSTLFKPTHQDAPPKSGTESDRKPKILIMESKIRAIEDQPKAKTIDADVKAESPQLVMVQETCEESPVQTPPSKKTKLSFFTGKIAVSEGAVMVRKSATTAHEESRDQNNRISHDQNKIEIKSEKMEVKEENPPAIEVAGLSDSRTDLRQRTNRSGSELSTGRSIIEDLISNSHLTTPLCWSKHVSLLSKYIENETVDAVTRWDVDQVISFLVKFGMTEKDLDKFKAEEIDGEALLCLTQSDLVDLLEMKLGPAIKVHNTLLLLKEKTQYSADTSNL